MRPTTPSGSGRPGTGHQRPVSRGNAGHPQFTGHGPQYGLQGPPPSGMADNSMGAGGVPPPSGPIMRGPGPVPAMAPPGTGMRGPPPGTGMRTALGSRSGLLPGMGVAAGVPNVADRPVTQQGMSGMKSSAGRTGRVVQDRSYYLTMLHQKQQELKTEFDRLSSESNRMESEQREHEKYKKKSDEQEAELKKLQGQLEDYNITKEKQRLQIPVDMVKDDVEALKTKTAAEEDAASQLWLQKTQKENQSKEYEQKIVELHEQMAAKMGVLSPDNQELYLSMKAENDHLQARIPELRAKLNEESAKLHKLEDEFKYDHTKQEIMKLGEERQRLSRRKAECQHELDKSNLSLPEAKAQIVAEIKQGKEETARNTEQITAVENEIDEVTKRIQALDTDIDEDPAGSKYRELVNKDKQMQQFLDSFAEEKQKDVDSTRFTQDTVVHLLEHISRNLAKEGKLPSQNQYTDMKDDLDFKKKQTELSENTLEGISQELAARQQELTRINNLDEKIATQLKEKNEQITKMKQEMESFGNIEQLRTSNDTDRKKLSVMKRQRIKRKDTLKQQTSIISSRYEAKKQQLAENEMASQLETLEQKLRQYEQNIFSLKEYIESKGREANYQPLIQDVTNLAYELNNSIIANLQAQGPLGPQGMSGQYQPY